MPSVTPIVALRRHPGRGRAHLPSFTVEELVNGWRHGFQARGKAVAEPIRPPIS
jgi:hypothetical protein